MKTLESIERNVKIPHIDNNKKTPKEKAIELIDGFLNELDDIVEIKNKQISLNYFLMKLVDLEIGKRNSITKKTMKTRDLYQELENWEAVSYRMREEGIEYCFKNYSTWSEIKDEEFHKLRNEFLSSTKNIRVYINNKLIETKELIDENT